MRSAHSCAAQLRACVHSCARSKAPSTCCQMARSATGESRSAPHLRQVSYRCMEPPEIHMLLGICTVFRQYAGTHIPQGLVKKYNIVPRMRLDDCSNSHFQAIFNLLNVARPSTFEKETTYKNNLTYFLQPISGESRMDSALGGRLPHFCAVQLIFESNHTFCMLSNKAITISTILAFLY